MSKIEIVTNYFPPELGASANQISRLAKGLKQAGHDVEVTAPLPNYPKGEIFKEYQKKFFVREEIEGITVKRYWIYPTVSSSFILRFLGMLSFAISQWKGYRQLKKRQPNIMIVQYSPIFVSFSALILGRLLKGCKLVLNITDLWPLTASELGVMEKGSILYRLLTKVETFNYKSADFIMGHSDEILEHVNSYIEKPQCLYRSLPNNNGDAVLDTKKFHDGAPKIVYAGLLGVPQGVYELCKKIDFKRMGAEFHIYGRGNEEQKIKTLLNNNPGRNIYYHGMVTPKELHKKLPEYHASIVPLKQRIYGAVPSKIFELITFGVPILCCGDGEAADIVKENKVGFVSNPGDYASLKKNIIKLTQQTQEEYRQMLSNCNQVKKEQLDFDKQMAKLNHNLEQHLI